MRPRPQIQIGFATRLAAFYAAIFVWSGIQLPFFPLWLRAKGLDARMIGLTLAVPMVVRVFAIPLAAYEADRRDALRRTIVMASTASVVGYLLVALAEGPWLILLAFTLASFVYAPIMPLSDAYALKGLAARGRAYGPVRLWGSLAFIAGTFIAGAAADIIPARQLIWLIVATATVNAVTALGLEPITTEPAASSAQAPRTALLRDPGFLAVLAAAGLIQASHAVYYGFSALAWTAQGLDGTSIAALWALGVIAEIILFAFSAGLPVRLHPSFLLMAGAAGGVLRWLAMAANPPALALPLLQLLHGASFGATHLGALTYLQRHVPPGQGATAQGYLSIALGLIMACATGISGVLFANYGSAAYAAMALMAAAGGVGAVIAHRLRHPVTAL